jgi:hypothetical protein
MWVARTCLKFPAHSTKRTLLYYVKASLSSFRTLDGRIIELENFKD